MVYCKMATLRERFEAKFIPEPNSGCWLWTAAVNRGGYGSIGTGRKAQTMLAHRAAYELYCAPVPADMDVLHKCDTPACVNPAHLRLGTAADNVRDMVQKGRGKTRDQRGTKHHNARLKEDDILFIRSSPEPREVLAIRFGCSEQHIANIRNRQKWKHV